MIYFAKYLSGYLWHMPCVIKVHMLMDGEGILLEWPAPKLLLL